MASNQTVDDKFVTEIRKRTGIPCAFDAGERLTYRDYWEQRILAADALADAIAAFHNLPRAQPASIKYRAELFEDLSLQFLREAWIFPYEFGEETVLAVADPTRFEAIRSARLATGAVSELRIAAFDELEVLFEQAFASGRAAASLPASTLMQDARSEDDLQRLQDLASGAPVVRAVDEIFDAAVMLSATDIHIESQEDGLAIRLRVDGLLRPYGFLPAAQSRPVISRVKILAGLDIAERRLPQDGRTRIRVGGADVDLRVATVAGLHGETAVVRLLSRDAKFLDLAALGMAEDDLAAVNVQIQEPHGLVIVAGPTGSGKTTTLASILSVLNTPDRKIITVEDPVEYQIPGLVQTQVKPAIGYTFATAIRSFLRHDPNVLMVGEMRDRETADIAIQAALTGHLLLTTLHTNSAAEAVVRLADLGIDSFLLRSTLRCVVGQRLVRQLCARCRRPTEECSASASALADAGRFQPRPEDSYFVAVGCSWCGGTGYRGRIGLFEVIRLDEGLRTLIRSDVDASKLAQEASTRGMRTMLQDGMEKYRCGITTVEEVLRATI
ncbi:putative general secretory pathway protein E [Aurantimonas manganoxydans SI85-9A1]|uniref:Putative general secretory pathway protein E n=1 Tax=Aurantimonas manganoxydans (strain ATCC BAA-1229 / DSM 21871 / SI85-9A1) TaxID=287752 RepID=Q1YMR9_AURMS|nr:GspE/PulE family protein [Aurantimonas manganoxydans]EAS51312.1 putative general secretory pathway protein E [Aurantimonas manganoxydans SI85-9A1]